MSSGRAFAKINLGLVVGPLRPDGKHEIATLLQRVGVYDDIKIGHSGSLVVEGFAEDTLVRTALELLARDARVEPRWHVHIDKRIPIAAGLGGGSSDAATALAIANAALDEPVSAAALHRLAAQVGADVPFFLQDGPRLATGDGTDLSPAALPTGYHVVLVVPSEAKKESTAAVYTAFDARNGADGYDRRAAAFRSAYAALTTSSDLALLPPNDLASSPLARELETAGAFRADVSGAGPTVYGLFEHRDDARRAAEALARAGSTFVTRPVEAGDLG